MRRAVPLLALCLACSAPDPAPQLAPPSILLVTLDTTRADRIGAYGYAAAGTPTLDRLAREGILFEMALAPAPITLPSHASILSGVEPPVHGARDNGIFVVSPDALLVSEVLRRHGWRTGAFVGTYLLAASFGLDRGFETYTSPALSYAGVNMVAERDADAVVGDAVAWLEDVEPEERWFAWVHLYDPHASYAPPPHWAERFEDPYDGEIAFCDAQLARLLDRIEQRGLDRNLLVVVTADHGESLGEHGEQTHGILLHQGALRVPLLIAGPAVRSARGARVSHPVSPTALPATLLTLAGLPPGEMPDLAEPSLLAPDGTPAEHDGALYIETHLPYYGYRWRALRGLVHGRLKLVEGAWAELYDIVDDPGETRDLARAQPEALAAMRSRLSAAVAEHEVGGRARIRALSGEEREMLGALGYVAGAVGGNPYDPSLPDPRAHVTELSLYDDAAQQFAEAVALRQRPAPSAWQRDHNEQEALAKLRASHEAVSRLVQSSPDAMAPVNLLGLVELQLGHPDAAIEVLEGHIERYPSDAVGHYNLALAYLGAGRGQDGVRALERAMALQPRNPVFRMRLAQHYLDSGDPAQAAAWLERARELSQRATPLWAELDALEARIEALHPPQPES